MGHTKHSPLACSFLLPKGEYHGMGQTDGCEAIIFFNGYRNTIADSGAKSANHRNTILRE